jgi:4-amino-4-deoxy-L-arabinose transferase-like glycosyltransferase
VQIKKLFSELSPWQNKKLSFALSPFVWLVTICAAAKFTIHMLTAANYGYFCDELYTIALSKHLAFGYVDLPPLVPALVALSRTIFGESLFAMHIFPALAGAATLVFVCLIIKEMGGKLFAIGLSALGYIMVPIWLIVDSFFCYDCIDQLILAIFLYFLVRLIRTGNTKLWLLLSFLAGIACMAKVTILLYGPGLLIALLISKNRKNLGTPWPWLGLGIFLIVISPYLIWEHFNHWPTLEYWANYSKAKASHYSILEYLINILLTMNPLLIPVLLIGLYRIFKRFNDINYNFFGIVFLVTFVLIFIMHQRVFMLVTLITPLIAAGSIFIEEKISGLSRKKWLQISIVTYLIAGAILVIPASIPILPIKLLPAYAKSFGFLYQPVKDFTSPKSEYPQEFSNRIGWI